jgi:nitroreductase
MVMETLESIRTRRSVRRYKSQDVPEDVIQKILAAGMSAPSAGNAQPWHFIVITEKHMLEAAARISPYAKMVKDAPVAILVCGNLQLEKFAGFWVQDCSAATQNMLLAANALGLGAVWTGIYPIQDFVDGFKTLFKLPENIIPLALVPIGYPAHEYRRKDDRFKEDRIHYNTW